MKRISILIIAALALLAGSCQKASETSTTTASNTGTTGITSTITNTTTATTTSGTLSAEDRDFVTKAAQGGMMEVNLGQLAASKATSNDVKDFGNRMVADHGKANDELRQLAANKGMTLPTQEGDEEKKTSNELSQKNGKDFDKAYISDMVKDHEKDAAEFEKASKEVKDPDLKAWASKTLTVIQDHLKMAK